MTIKTENIVLAIRNELIRAERKFPRWPTDPVHAAAIVAEEAGELVQASLQATYEVAGDPADQKERVMREAVQCAAMCIRLLEHINDGKPHQHYEDKP